MHTAGDTTEGGGPKRVQVSLDGDLAHKGRVIAALAGTSLPDLVNTRLRPIIEADFAAAVVEMNRPMAAGTAR